MSEARRLVVAGGLPGHTCNAYCLNDVHAQVFYRQVGQEGRRPAKAGDRVLLYGRWARIISTQPAPEAPDPSKFTAASRALWFFRWDGL